jgi:hypothetical protein
MAFATWNLPPDVSPLSSAGPPRPARVMTKECLIRVRGTKVLGPQQKVRRRGDVSRVPMRTKEGGRLRQEQAAGVMRHAPCARRHGLTSGAKHFSLPRLFGGLQQDVRAPEPGAFETRLRNIPDGPHVQLIVPCRITSIRIFPTPSSQLAPTWRITRPFPEERACDSHPTDNNFPDPPILAITLARPVSQTFIHPL